MLYCAITFFQFICIDYLLISILKWSKTSQGVEHSFLGSFEHVTISFIPPPLPPPTPNIHPYCKAKCKHWGQGVTPKTGQNSEFSFFSKSWHFNVCFYPTLEQRAEMSRLFFWVEILGGGEKSTNTCLAKTKHFAWHFQAKQNISTFLKSKCFLVVC